MASSTSSSVMSSGGLGMYRGCYLAGKARLTRRQLSSVKNESRCRSRAEKNSSSCSLNQTTSVALGKHQQQQQRLFGLSQQMPLFSTFSTSAPSTTSGRGRAHLDASICRAFSSGVLVKEEIKDEEAFVEIGFIADTHGLQGELHVHSLTDFPEERFGKFCTLTLPECHGWLTANQPGLRWVRTQSIGRPSFQQVELLSGRIGPGKRPSWLVTLKNFDSVEKASELVGATILVEEDKRPPLDDEDEFYVPDLVGMTVALQESGEDIGIIRDVFSVGGGNDLLQVSLVSKTDNGDSETEERKIWIPFVKEIVPIVDKGLRRVEIDPPQGLLELNAPTKSQGIDESKKAEIKEKRKQRRMLGGLKKRLTAMGQTHTLAGLSSGTQDDRNALLEQLLSIDFELLQQALEGTFSSSSPSARLQRNPEPPPAFPKVNWQRLDLLPNGEGEEDIPEDQQEMKRWWREGLQLIADGRVAVAVLAGGQSTRLGQSAPPMKGMGDLSLPSGKSLFQLQAERLLLVQELASLVVDPEVNPFIPWIVMTSDATDKPTQDYFEEKGFFGLDESQVWFIKQDSMPCVSLQSPDGHHDILMESPWKVAQAPNGNGGLFSTLHGEGVIDRLSEEGIDYVQVYAVDNALVRVADPVFFGYTMERQADISIKVVNKVYPEEAVGVLCLERGTAVVGEVHDFSMSPTDEVPSTSRYAVLEYSEIPGELRNAYEEEQPEHGLDANSPFSTSTSGEKPLRFRAAHICVNIFSVDFLRRLADAGFDFEFHGVRKQIPHVKQGEDGWENVAGDEPNGMKLELFIFDAFRFCHPDKVALLEVHRDEEFAPVKNAPGKGVPDTADTARNLVLALQRRLASLPSSPSESTDSQQHNLTRKVLVAYLGALVDEDVLKLLDHPEDSQ